jgi:hypothetical protein
MTGVYHNKKLIFEVSTDLKLITLARLKTNSFMQLTSTTRVVVIR